MLYPDPAVTMDLLSELSNKELLNKDEVLLYVLLTEIFYRYLKVALQYDVSTFTHSLQLHHMMEACSSHAMQLQC